MWSDLAVANLEEIFTYISKDNPRAGRQVLQRIVNKVETLREIPFMGAVYSPDEDPCVREVLCGKHRIFYRVNEAAKRIEVAMIWHSARMGPKLPI
jgi:plasmid stabilization system protein ParE